jgi:hypothetical protein
MVKLLRLCIFAVSLTTVLGYHLDLQRLKLISQKMIIGDELLLVNETIPYTGSSRSPGDLIGYTWYDYQANGSFGQRMAIDNSLTAPFIWFYMDALGTIRSCHCNLRYSDGAYFGEWDATYGWGGMGQLDVIKGGSDFGVIAYNYQIDVGPYSWPNNPQDLPVPHHRWPYVAMTRDTNIIVATGNLSGDSLHLYLTTDEGDTWSLIADFDSCATLSQFVRASNNSGSNKVVFVHTQFITDTITSGQLDNNVWYMLSADAGVTWGSHINITNYQPTDTVRAYCNVNAIFDNNDKLHIFWAGRRVIDGVYYEASKIFHWDEVTNNIAVVSGPNPEFPGGWWGWTNPNGYGAWRLPADQPQAAVDPATGWLYCLWHGNIDQSDTSAAGWPNGEFFGAFSTDNGQTWSAVGGVNGYVNLTNTHTPGASAGNCDDEDYMTCNPLVVNDSIWLTYIEDKDAGSMPHGEGSATENPVRAWLIPISAISGISESNREVQIKISLNIQPNPASKSSMILYTLPNSNNIHLAIYSIDGRQVRLIDSGYKLSGIHKISVKTDKMAQGLYILSLQTISTIVSHPLVIVR